MMSDQNEVVFDLCIVGAGLVGSAAARHASLRGHSICLIGPPEPKEPEEWKNREIFGSHYDEGRITRVWDKDVDFRVLNRASISRYQEIEDQSGIKFHSSVGCLFFGHKGTDMIERFQNEIGDGKEKTSANILSLSDRSDFQRKFPFLRCSADESGFLECGGAGHISPRRLVEAQKIIAAKNGCLLIEEVVESINYQCTEANENLQVITEKGTRFSCRKALLCTNAFTQMKPGLLPKGKQLDLRLKKTSAALIEISEEEASRLKNMPSMIYKDLFKEGNVPYASYSLPPIRYPNGKWYLKIGIYTDEEERSREEMTLPQMKEWFTSGGNEMRAEACMEFLKNLVPGIKIEGFDKLGCVICYTPSGVPFIDSITPDVYVAVGGNGVSAKSSDELGRIAAILAAEDVWDSHLNRSRFQVQWAET